MAALSHVYPFGLAGAAGLPVLVPGRLPGGGPVIARRIVAQIDITPTYIQRRVVIAVARQAAQAGVPVTAADDPLGVLLVINSDLAALS